jgi:hypothetical protein
MSLIRTLSAGVLLVATLTACVAPAMVSDEKDANGKKIEYAYFTPTGSNVPIRVPKDQLPSSDDDSATSNKAFQDMQRSGSAHLPQSPGGP